MEPAGTCPGTCPEFQRLLLGVFAILLPLLMLDTCQNLLILKWNLPEPVSEPAQNFNPSGVFSQFSLRYSCWNLPESVAFDMEPAQPVSEPAQNFDTSGVFSQFHSR